MSRPRALQVKSPAELKLIAQAHFRGKEAAAIRQLMEARSATPAEIVHVLVSEALEARARLERAS